MKQHHIHHDNILKWAKGAQMEYYDYDTDQWIETDNPQWDHEKTLWRAKETVICPLYLNSVERLSQKTSGVFSVSPRYIPTEFEAEVTYVDDEAISIKLVDQSTKDKKREVIDSLMNSLGFPSIRRTE